MTADDIAAFDMNVLPTLYVDIITRQQRAKLCSLFERVTCTDGRA